MPDFDEQVMGFLHQVKKLVPDKDAQRKMTKEGADVLRDRLQQETRHKHYDEKHYIPKKYRGRNIKHLADSIASDDKNINGEIDGSSLVGFQGVQESGVNHARIARFINDGTKKMRGDHFVEHTREDNAKEVFSAIAEKYRKDVEP